MIVGGGPGKVLATAKHFIGEGGTDEGFDQGSTRCTGMQLRDIHGQSHIAAIAAGAQVVMASFNDWNGSKLHGDKHLLTHVLKEQMGFMGFVISDWNAFQQVRENFGEACAESVKAGIDMLMAPDSWRQVHEHLLSQFRNGSLSPRRVDDAVTRILRVKERMGLFAKPRPSRRAGAGNGNTLAAPRHRAIARQAVRESLVLLKNEGGILPLRPDLRVLVAGDGANNIGKQCGGWTLTWQGSFNENEDFPSGDSIYRGIEERVTAAGGSAVLNEDGEFRERPDVAIVVFGEDPYAEGQGDVSHLSFSARQPEPLRILQKLVLVGIVVICVGVLPTILLRERFPDTAAGFAGEASRLERLAGETKRFLLGFVQTFSSRPFLKLCGATFLVFNGFQLIAAFQSYVIIYYVFSGDVKLASYFIALFQTITTISTFAVVALAATSRAVAAPMSRINSGLAAAPRPMLCGKSVAPKTLLWPCTASVPQMTGMTGRPSPRSTDAW